MHVLGEGFLNLVYTEERSIPASILRFLENLTAPMLSRKLMRRSKRVKLLALGPWYIE